MDLFAWLTLANGDETGFVEAVTHAVAGAPNREEADAVLPRREPIRLCCWPAGTTTPGLSQPQTPPPSPPPAPPPATMQLALGVTLIINGCPATPSPLPHQPLFALI